MNKLDRALSSAQRWRRYWIREEVSEMKHPKRLLVVLGLLALALYVTPASVAAPPSNDDFANATVVTSLPFSNVVAVNEATTESAEPGAEWDQSRTVWYSFMPTSDLFVKADLGGSDYVTAFMSVYRADSAGFGGLTKIAGGAYGPAFTFRLEAGTTYYIQEGDMYHWGWVSTIGINLQVVNPPPNDNFADAIAFTSVPFSDSQDLTAATVEPGEPMACGTTLSQSTWYAFTPTTSGSYGSFALTGVNVYTGTSLNNLTNVACYDWPGLYFWAEAGTTYYLQDSGGGMLIDAVAPPQIGFLYSPGDPSAFDNVTFSYWIGGYWDPTVTGWSWDFGDGTTATGESVPHRFARDGDYTVRLTVSARGGRSNSQTQTVQVRTHDVAIFSFSSPNKGRVGRASTITVDVGTTRYPERVQVDLYKTTPPGLRQLVGTLTNVVPVSKKTIPFTFSYVFTNDDLAAGKVAFEATATVQGARDALPADNTATAPPTFVTR